MTISNAFSTFNEACASPQEIIKMFMPKNTHTRSSFSFSQAFLCSACHASKMMQKPRRGIGLPDIYIRYIPCVWFAIPSVLFFDHFYDPHESAKATQHFVVGFVLYRDLPPHSPYSTPLTGAALSSQIIFMTILTLSLLRHVSESHNLSLMHFICTLYIKKFALNLYSLLLLRNTPLDYRPIGKNICVAHKYF